MGKRMDFSPRKVNIANCMFRFSSPHGGIDFRLREIEGLAGKMLQQKLAKENGIDLAVLPEFSITASDEPSVGKRAVRMERPLLDRLGELSRRLGSYLVIPGLISEHKDFSTVFNRALLFSRTGDLVGSYDKVHLPSCELEDGVSPGTSYPVFDCDFGRIGIQICYDVCKDAGWLELARKGAEIVALPSASPQTCRPSSHALRNGYWVVSSTPRDNASIFTPLGFVFSQITQGETVEVTRIDISSICLHWSAKLDDGLAFKRVFGDKVGFLYSSREDGGVFWSNDYDVSIKEMAAGLGLTLESQADA